MNSKNRSSYLPAIIISIVLHLLFIALLIWGAQIDLFEKVVLPPPGNSINAVIMDVDPMHQYNEQQALKRKQAQDAKAKADAIEAKANRDAALRQKELLAQKKAKQDAIDKAKKEAIAKEQARLKAIKEAKAAQLKAQEDALAEKRRIDAEMKEKEAKAKALILKKEKEKKAQADAKKQKEAQDKKIQSKQDTKTANAQKSKEAQLQAEATKDLESLDDELQFGGDITGTSSEVAKGADDDKNSDLSLTEANMWSSRYGQLIKQKLIINETFKGKICTFRVKLARTGQILSATNPQGDPLLCDAVRSAIARQDIFPMPKDPKVIDELLDLNLKVIL